MHEADHGSEPEAVTRVRVQDKGNSRDWLRLAGEEICVESILRLRLKKPQLEILKSTLAQHADDKVSRVQTVYHHVPAPKAPQKR